MAQTADRGGAGSITVTVQDPSSSASTSLPPSSSPPTGQVLTLKLAPRRKKKVTWQAGTVDNEFMNKKSSKKCCIFHKEKPFDEDDSDEDNHDDHDHDRDKGKGQWHDTQSPADGEGNSSHIACCSHNH